MTSRRENIHDPEVLVHTHLTTTIKPLGECPACDAYCRPGQPIPFPK